MISIKQDNKIWQEDKQHEDLGVLFLDIDNDKDGLLINETPISGAISLGGGIYEFQNVNTLDDDEQFTLGTINTTQTPLPIDLISFDAKLILSLVFKIFVF